MHSRSLKLTYRLVAGIVTLIAESFLEQPDKVLVSTKEVNIIMKLHGVRHMIRDEVVEST